MSEAIWFFADGDEERGPVTEAQIRALIGTGHLRPDDLVWREGMEDWAPARELPSLFGKSPGGTAVMAANGSDADAVSPEGSRRRAGPPASHTPLVAASRSAWKRPLNVFAPLGFAGQPLMLVGLLMVILSRGCEATGQRHVQRLNVRAEMEEARFEARGRRARADLQQQLVELESVDDLTPAGRTRRDRLQQALRELETRQEVERQQLRDGAWQELQEAAEEARRTNVVWDLWRGRIFWLGTLLLAFGLCIIGFTHHGAPQWVCLAMLAVLLLSLYFGYAP